MDLINQLAGTLGIDAGTAQALAGGILGQVKGQLTDNEGTEAAGELEGALPEMGDWAGKAASLLGEGGVSDLLGGGGLLVVLSIDVLGGGGDGLLLLVGGGDDIGGDTEGLDEVVDTGVGHGVVAPLPVENVLEVTSALEGLDDHHNVQVWHGGDLLMTWKVSVLLDNNDTLSEDVLEGISSVLSGNQNHCD